jgi:hypothetical protein
MRALRAIALRPVSTEYSALALVRSVVGALGKFATVNREFAGSPLMVIPRVTVGAEVEQIEAHGTVTNTRVTRSALSDTHPPMRALLLRRDSTVAAMEFSMHR